MSLCTRWGPAPGHRPTQAQESGCRLISCAWRWQHLTWLRHSHRMSESSKGCRRRIVWCSRSAGSALWLHCLAHVCAAQRGLATAFSLHNNAWFLGPACGQLHWATQGEHREVL